MSTSTQPSAYFTPYFPKTEKENERRMQQRIIDSNFISGFNKALNNLIDTNTINPVLSIQFTSLQSN